MRLWDCDWKRISSLARSRLIKAQLASLHQICEWLVNHRSIVYVPVEDRLLCGFQRIVSVGYTVRNDRMRCSKWQEVGKGTVKTDSKLHTDHKRKTWDDQNYSVRATKVGVNIHYVCILPLAIKFLVVHAQSTYTPLAHHVHPTVHSSTLLRLLEREANWRRRKIVHRFADDDTCPLKYCAVSWLRSAWQEGSRSFRFAFLVMS